jgi:NADH-quinone oxidoreductase subunit H
MDSSIIIEKVSLSWWFWNHYVNGKCILAERKVAAWLQDRVGPNRAGKGGLLQPLADGLKLFAKEEFEPDTPNRFFFFTGPAIAMTTALMTSAVIPWGDRFHLFGKDIILQATDIDVALLYLIGVMSIGVYGIMIGGWASNNKFSLIVLYVPLLK